ncbi:MAG: tRNA 2-thiouridine(34) synthase MnmA [bacterium]|nr:tRNA 2-thiouridine(34) synthase MnmA [bacterium]
MRIAALLSGGVDSSVALRLLHAENHELVAFYLKIWLEDELSSLGRCPWEEDLRHAHAVCEEVGVPLEVVPLQREYHERVVSWTISELSAGRTPSPDILCNRHIKFGAFLDHLDSGRADRRFDKVASGHYARIRDHGGRLRLLRGVDPVKDQSYFLFQLDQRQLERSVFPVGGCHKSEVRRLAREFGLPNHDRRDSQGICFLGKLRYDEFVKSYLGERRGEIREVDSGRRLGEHRGVWFHTIGQRKGLGLPGGPWFVVRRDIDRNVLFVSHQRDMVSWRRDRFRIPEVHWIAEAPTRDRLQVRIRHSPALLDCRTAAAADGGLEIHLDGDDPGIAAGQWAVLYDGEECLGGGMIANPRS